jgi:hypothetical protein
MAAISFLELVPKRPRATVKIDSETGPAEFEIMGVSLAQLADIAKKFPSFLRVIENGEGMFTASEALPSLIAASLDHHGDAEYERKAARLPADMVLALAGEIVRLTFPGRPSIALAETEPAPEASDETRSVVISPLRLSS